MSPARNRCSIMGTPHALALAFSSWASRFTPITMTSIVNKPGATTPDRADLARRSFEEAWAREARYDRWLGLIASVGVLGGWVTDYLSMGLSSTTMWTLLVRVIAALTAVPFWAATFAPRPPRWLTRAKLVFLATFPNVVIVLMMLQPSRGAIHGWVVVFMWAILQMTMLAPLRAKILLGMMSLGVYVAGLFYVVPRMGEAYGKPYEIYAVIACALPCILAVPWLPHRMEERRIRELATRIDLEREVELRKDRERALEIAKEEAERATRELRGEKARADEAADRARAAAQRAELETQKRAALFANMSHDLRTPMAGILGLVELMRATELTEEQRGYVETIRASNQTLIALLNDVIDVSRIEEGKLPLAPMPAPVGDTLRAAADLLRVSAERKGVSLRVELDPGLPDYARLDPVRVQQIVLNLLGNGLKFTERGTVTMRAMRKDWVGQRGLLRVEVEDSGIGFNAEQRKRLFQRFNQADDATAQKFGGSGLGLSICAGLVMLMGGSIGAEGEPGKGALFWFEIPTEETKSPSGAGASEVPILRVLLAEDNPVNQMVLHLMLKKLGQEVTVASDGKQALRLLTEQRFDLAVMDMQMPILNGDEVTRRLRMLSGTAALTFVVALTASATAEESAKFTKAGVDAIYTKPIDMDGLRRMLAKEGPRALARRNASRAANRA